MFRGVKLPQRAQVHPPEQGSEPRFAPQGAPGRIHPPKDHPRRLALHHARACRVAPLLDRRSVMSPVLADAIRPASLDESAGRHAGTALAPHRYDA